MRTPALALVLTATLAGCTALPLPREGSYHDSDADLAVTRIVHGSLVLEASDTRFLVDPWYHSTFWRRQTEPLGLTPERLPPAAAVLVTHRHTGHYDPEALAEIAKRTPRAIVPPVLADAVRAHGFAEVTPIDWWESTMVGTVRVTAVPAGHTVRENGYVLVTERVRAYVAGDTRPFPELADVATAFPRLDVAFLPVGGERFFGWKRTMTPAEAADAAALLQARRIVPVAYGAGGGAPFAWWASAPVATFREAAAAREIPPERVVVLEPGESWHYYR
jgi:L-ascorbate metabolism protein UlaG (beta-lactamase superfamily)